MAICRSADSSDPFRNQFNESIKDDLDELFNSEEANDIFRSVDFSTLDIDDLDVSVFSSYDSEDDSKECLKSKCRELKNHECMWGGQCCNKEFQRTQVPHPPRPVQVFPLPTPKQPVLITHSSQNKVVTIQKCIQQCSGSDRTENVVVVTNNIRTPKVKTEGRSLLLNRTTQQSQTPVLNPSPVKVVKREILTPQSSRPETPQSLSDSDEEEIGPIPIDTHNTSIFRSALDVLTTSSVSSCDWEDELCIFSDMKRTKGEKGLVSSRTDILRSSAITNSDHNYGVSSKNVKLEGLGVDTPSDSEEEEIDVVSLSERSSSSRSSSCSGLPTRPTRRDQEHLEEITTSLLSASQAVSRKLLKKTITTNQVTKQKRKKYRSESSDDDDDEEELEESMIYTKYHHRRQKKRQKPSPSRSRRKKVSRFGEEEDSKEKRDLHNNMERMRRIDLRNSFEELKALVPSVARKERAAKVVILRDAANYCDELGAESQSKYMQVMALKKEQERLRAMVSSLRKAAAMACIKTPKRCY